MNIVIAEDDADLVKTLSIALKIAAPHINILPAVSSIEEARELIQQNKEGIDLMFCKTEFKDGNSLQLFENDEINIPVVFIIDQQQSIKEALHHNGIDFIQQPIDKKDIEAIIRKYKKLKAHFSDQKWMYKLLKTLNESHKKFLIARKGTENICLPLQNVVLIYTSNKVTYILDKEGQRYLHDKILSELEEDLDKRIFFRLNRQYIVNLSYIKGYSIYERVKLKIELTTNFPEPLIISQETAPLFRKWIAEA